MNYRVPVAAAAILLLAPLIPCQQPNIDDFFRNFTAEWVRSNPNLATSSRYFTGEEQDRLERQLTPETLAYRRARIQLAKQGLAQLQKFDHSKFTATQRI